MLKIPCSFFLLFRVVSLIAGYGSELINYHLLSSFPRDFPLSLNSNCKDHFHSQSLLPINFHRHHQTTHPLHWKPPTITNHRDTTTTTTPSSPPNRSVRPLGFVIFPLLERNILHSSIRLFFDGSREGRQRLRRDLSRLRSQSPFLKTTTQPTKVQQRRCC